MTASINHQVVMNILITNDDGVRAQGLLALKAALDKVGRVFVVAPDRPRSACGHSITLHKPLRAEKVTLADGSTAYACSGTPSDCVSLALLGLLEEKMDLVVSGINHGPNLGWDLTYSGTVSAAMEGVVSGVQSFAISVASNERDVDYSLTARVAARIAAILQDKKLPQARCSTSTFPVCRNLEIKGVEVTRQGTRGYLGVLEKRVDPCRSGLLLARRRYPCGRT